MLVPGLNIGGSDSQDTVSINRELLVEFQRSSRSGGNVVEVELTENVVVLSQRSLTFNNVKYKCSLLIYKM